jgi:glyceraldehyde-3-phosphate dehydrogenase/erythrose-4-phosphate dehydrogenase
MTVQVGINGFGRIGCCAFRSAIERGDEIEWVGINDLAETATLAHLLRHDTVYGPLKVVLTAEPVQALPHHIEEAIPVGV